MPETVPHLQRSLRAPGTSGREAITPFLRLDGAVDSVEFNFTNECNLRCVYCPQGSHEEGFHADTPMAQLDGIVAYIKKHGVKKASVGYYGETTMVEGWQEVCQELLDFDVEMTIVSNFGRVLTPREVEVLAQFTEIQVSIDIVDQKILRAVRKAVDVRSILYNCQLIQAHALLYDLPIPRMIWTGVMTDAVVMGLSHLVATAAVSSIKHINFNSVGYFDGALQESMHICDMDDDAFLLAAEEIERALALAKKHGIQLKVQDHGRIMRKLVELTGKTRVLDNGHYLASLDDLSSVQRIFVYGSGAPGRYVAARIKERPELQFEGFLDSSWTGEVDDSRVQRLDAYLENRRDDDLILVCSGAYDEIEVAIRRKGIDRYLDAREIYLYNAGRSGLAKTEKKKRQGIQGSFEMVDDEGDELAEGLTRLCDSPWSQVYTDPKGEVYSCCQRGEVMGELSLDTGLEDVLNAKSYRELREQLLTGVNLNPECSQCMVKPPTNPATLQRWIAKKRSQALV